MKKQKYFRFSIRSFFAVFTLATLLSGDFASAGLFSVKIPSASDMAAELERRYHLNTNSMIEQGENFNVAAQKGSPPKALLYFTPTDPEPGKEIEARAFPEFFSAEPETLYYTWYIKRKDCDLCQDCAKEKLLACDINKDDRITTEDWKIEAAQRNASNNFDWKCEFKTHLSDDERLACKNTMYDPDAPSTITAEKNKTSNRDSDGYIASFGGDNRPDIGDYNQGSNTSTTQELIIKDGDRFFSSDTGNWYGEYWTVNDSVDAYQKAVFKGADGGDLSPDLTLSDSALSSKPIPGNSYTISFEIYTNTNTGDIGDMKISFAGSEFLVGTTQNQKKIVTQAVIATNTDGLIFKPQGLWKGTIDNVSILGTGATNVSNGNNICYIHDFIDGYNYELPSCKHLFPGNYSINNPTGDSITKDGQLGESDGDFSIDEEHFWHTNPEDPSTAGNGVKDEANLVGLGQDAYRWIYAPGDQVSVAIEGPSMYSTKYDNSSPMIMWALPKNECDVTGKSSRKEIIKGYEVEIETANTDINDCLEDNLVDPTEGGQAENVKLTLSAFPENPIAKLIEGENVLKNADTLTVSALDENTSTDTTSFSYTWKVKGSTDFNVRFDDETEWKDVDSILRNSKNLSILNGNGVNSVSLNLNLVKDTINDAEGNDTNDFQTINDLFVDDDIAYFQFSVSATRNFQGITTQSGAASTIIKVIRSKSGIVTHLVTVDPDNYLLNFETDGADTDEGNEDIICPKMGFADNIKREVTICPVLNNQIIGVRFSGFQNDDNDKGLDFQWTLNDQTLLCTKDISPRCSDTRQSRVNFFPVSGNIGDIYTLSVIANEVSTGKSITITRHFQIVEPSLRFTLNADANGVEDTSTVWRRYLGKYTNLDNAENSETPNYSQTAFEGIPGALATFTGEFQPPVLRKLIQQDVVASNNQQSGIVWSVNGNVTKINDPQHSILLNGNPGDIYTISCSGAYIQPPEIRQALFNIWGISPYTSETIRFSRQGRIRIVAEGGGEPADAIGKANLFLASILSAVPPLVIFSVRLALSLMLILFIVGIAFSKLPERREE